MRVMSNLADMSCWLMYFLLHLLRAAIAAHHQSFAGALLEVYVSLENVMVLVDLNSSAVPLLLILMVCTLIC